MFWADDERLHAQGVQAITRRVLLGRTQSRNVMLQLLDGAGQPRLQLQVTPKGEATLSFLGLGLPITEPSLGLLISNGFNYLMSGKYWISFFPGIALLITVLSINLVADQLRDVLNPRLQQH